jgi:hypothetical protein
MAPTRPFDLIYAPATRQHPKAIEPKHYSPIRSAIEAQLRFEPEVETRNRKPLKRPVDFEAEWEIRLGPDNRFRVYYMVDPEKREVHILAIGEKKGNRLLVAGEEIVL